MYLSSLSLPLEVKAMQIIWYVYKDYCWTFESVVGSRSGVQVGRADDSGRLHRRSAQSQVRGSGGPRRRELRLAVQQQRRELRGTAGEVRQRERKYQWVPVHPYVWERLRYIDVLGEEQHRPPSGALCLPASSCWWDNSSRKLGVFLVVKSMLWVNNHSLGVRLKNSLLNQSK